MDTKAESRKQLTITIDGNMYTTPDDDQEAAALLRMAGRDPEVYDLARVKPNGEQQVLADGHVIELKDGDTFVSVIFGVKVNGIFVPLDGRRLSGAALKAAAIKAGAPIESDFVLSEVLPSGEQKVVADDREIKVKHGDEFWAVPGDDNS